MGDPMKHAQVIQFAAGLEEKIDTRLFRALRPEDDPNSVNNAKTVKGAVLAGGLVVGGTTALNGVRKYANSPAVADRLSGMRITRPGFRDLSPGMQRTVATVSRAGSDIAGGVKSTASALGREAAYRGRGLFNTVENAGIGALRKAKPLAKNLLARVGALAAKVKI